MSRRVFTISSMGHQKGLPMCQGEQHDWRVNPFQTIKTWPARLYAVCVDCGEERQVPPRGWTLSAQEPREWPRISMPRTEKERQDRLFGVN